uniref:Uncharacterized protein n=1 Tax=Myotis lucifugus TaxID=59463 RepID=G1PD35_MYOLU
MGTRVRTAAIWVPPLQDGDSSGNRIRKRKGQAPIVGLGTPDQRPLPGGPQQRHKSHRTEQALEWLFISQEQRETTEFQIPTSLFHSFIYFFAGEGDVILNFKGHSFESVIIVCLMGFVVLGGYQHTKPDIILQLEQEELRVVQDRILSHGHPGE